MTRKHFQMIAETVNRTITHENGNTTKIAATRRETARDMAYSFSVELRKENARFDSARFLEACFAGTEFAKVSAMNRYTIHTQLRIAPGSSPARWEEYYMITEPVDAVAADGHVIGTRSEAVVEWLPNRETAERYRDALENGAHIAPNGAISY